MSGLDQLKQASNKRKGGGRPMPPPRHKPRQDQVELPADASPPQSDPAPAPQSSAPSVAAPFTTATPAVTPAPTPAPAAAAPQQAAMTSPAAQPARKVGPTTMYFDAETDDWMEDVLAIGRRGTPKVSSKSAIARLAIRELAKRMSAEQVVEEIRRGAASTSAQPGRPKL